MINPKKITEALPSYRLAENEGTTELRNPKEDTVAKYDSRRGIFEIDGDHPDHEKVIHGLQKAGMNIEINRKQKPEPLKKASGWSRAHSITESLKGDWEEMRTTIEWDYNNGQVVVETNDYQTAKDLYKRYLHEPLVFFEGRERKVLICRVPKLIFKTPSEIIGG